MNAHILAPTRTYFSYDESHSRCISCFPSLNCICILYVYFACHCFCFKLNKLDNAIDMKNELNILKKKIEEKTWIHIYYILPRKTDSMRSIVDLKQKAREKIKKNTHTQTNKKKKHEEKNLIRNFEYKTKKRRRENVLKMNFYRLKGIFRT